MQLNAGNIRIYSLLSNLFFIDISALSMKKLLTFLLLISLQNVLANDLKNNSSPYLAMHGNDPVNWMEWGKPAIEKAKKENKLLFVSIGYFSCHWCHVMQRESYSNKGIAEILNKNYISVKVDRELNPVLDKRLIEFVQITNGTAGWPLNVFLTPEGYPLVGATYMPREHFANVLRQLAKKWKADQPSLVAQAKEMSKTLNTMLQKQEHPTKGVTIQQLSGRYISTAMQYADTMQGGFGQQRKFPQIPQLWALLKLNQHKKNKEADEFIKLTLNQMMRKGLHDEIAGGFFRYATDPDWETPHFEKMIYTNAMMPLLYFDAADIYKNDQYRQVALETINFLNAEMRGSGNAYISSLSAVDDKNEEGGYYLWTRSELKKILTAEEYKLAKLYWNLDRASELPAGNLPRQERSIDQLVIKMQQPSEKIRAKIKALKLKLKKHRNKTRVIPRDTKLLSGMNGLTLAAFARALQYDSGLKNTGDKLSQFLLKLWNGKTLRRSASNAKEGTLYDYAATAWGLDKWGAATHNANIRQIAGQIAKIAWKRFYINNSWHENTNSLLPPGVKLSHISDSSLISAEALLLSVSLHSKDPELVKKASVVQNHISRSLETDIYAYPSLMALP